MGMHVPAGKQETLLQLGLNLFRWSMGSTALGTETNGLI